MVRLRDAVMAVALATGGVGCATFCDECDDFPMPGGPGNYHLMPGTYTGPPLSGVPEADTARAATPGQGSTPPPGGAPGTVPADVGEPTPPAAPPAGAVGDQGAMNAGGNSSPAVAASDRGPAESSAAASISAPGADDLLPLP